MNTKPIKLLTLIYLTVIGMILATSPAEAFSFFLDDNNLGDNEFTYSLTLDANESLNLGNPLLIDNLAGVTAVSTTDNPYSLASPSSFDPTSANFLVTTSVPSSTNSQTFNKIITITSDSSVVGNVNYLGGFDGGTFNSVTQGPIVAVPFKASPNFGVFLSLGFWGLLTIKSRSAKKLTRSK